MQRAPLQNDLLLKVSFKLILRLALAPHGSESESGYISSSHIRLIRCLAVIGQASFTREHLV